MNPYEQMINTMREEGAKRNPPKLQIGEMVSATTCKVGDIELEADDYLIAEHLTDYEIKIDIESHEKINASTNTVSSHSHKLTDLKTTKSKLKVYGALKKGDIVLVQRMSDEQYVIIERLVEL